MNYWRERLPAIRGGYVYLLPVLIAVAPVLGTCGISKCCGLRCIRLKPGDYDIELSRNVSGMFMVGVTSCPLCAQEKREWIRLVTVKDNEEAMDRLYGKIGLQLHRVAPVLGCGCFRRCHQRDCDIEPSDYDARLSKKLARMFPEGVRTCPWCAMNCHWIKFVSVGYNEIALDILHGKILFQLRRVKKLDMGNQLSIACVRFKKVGRRRIGCFVYLMKFYGLDTKVTPDLEKFLCKPRLPFDAGEDYSYQLSTNAFQW